MFGATIETMKSERARDLAILAEVRRS